MDSFFLPLFYIGECKCAFHYLSSYSKNVYFTLSFFSNACYYLGVHLNSHLTAYHFHMLEHILKCLLKVPVLNTNSIHPSTGLLINHHSHKKLFPLTVQQHTQSKGQKIKMHGFFEIQLSAIVDCMPSQGVILLNFTHLSRIMGHYMISVLSKCSTAVSDTDHAVHCVTWLLNTLQNSFQV